LAGELTPTSRAGIVPEMPRTSLRQVTPRFCLGGLFAAIAFLNLCVPAGAQSAKTLRAAEVAGKLDAIKESIAREMTDQLQRTNFSSSYTTVWRQFEDAAIDALKSILPRHLPELKAENFDTGTAGQEKNRLADFAIVIGAETIEISIKSARRFANPENDLGTFRDHPNRKKLFAASFTLWVRYDETAKAIRCERAFFDRSWRFVGKSSLVDGVKYRKKDGNLRPKPWAMFDAGESFWKSEEDFEAAVKRAEIFRANELIKEYLEDLSETDQRMLYERLQERFGRRNPATN
jgi:hypothetical protein